MSRALGVVCAAVLISTAARAQQDAGSVPVSSRDDPGESAYWSEAQPRFFISATLELGYPYARPKLAIGRGRPHWEWVGIEGLPLVTIEGVGAYGGVRGEVPNLDVRAGVRYFAPFDRSLLEIEDDYERLDIEQNDGPSGNYTAYEAEATAHAALPGGLLFGVLTGYYVPNVTTGFHLYEESLRVVMAPPFVWRARLGYAFEVGPDRNVRVGPAAEVIGLPGRDAYVYRAGIVGVAPVSATVDVQLTLLPVIASPDSIGLAGADFSHLGVRWRWATGAVPR